jgi:hypothetical protein
MLRDFIKKQNRNYYYFLKINSQKFAEEQYKQVYEFNFNQILNWHSINQSNNEGLIIINAKKNINSHNSPNFSVNEKYDRKLYDVFHNFFNFYYLNQAYNSVTSVGIETSKIEEFESFYTKYRKYLEEKYNSNNKENCSSNQQLNEQNKEMFMPLFSYFLNYLENKNKKNYQIDIFVQDIFIKKNFKYYSITPQKYDSKEYNILNTKYIEVDNKLNYSDLNENNNLNVFKIASENIKEKTIINQYDEIIKDKNKANKKNKNNEIDDISYNKAFEYEYNYPFIEEIFDGIQMDWRINYLMFTSLFVTMYFLIFSISQMRYQKDLEKFGRNMINYALSNTEFSLSNSYFFYFTCRSPIILNFERYMKLTVIDGAKDKYRTNLIMNMMNHNISIFRHKNNLKDNNSKENLKI